jgi:hypothetical protein
VNTIERASSVLLALLLSLGAVGCAGRTERAGAGSPSDAEQPKNGVGLASGTPAPSRTPAHTPVPNPCDVEESLPVGATCWVDFYTPANTPVRVLYTIPTEGWGPFLGPYKDVEEGGQLQRVNVNFAKIANLTVDACTEQRSVSPPVGPTVDDLANALTALPPFEVVSPPEDVTAYGYRGKYLAIRVPLDQPFGDDLFGSCRDHVLRTWIAPPLSFAFYGYTGPGDVEEFWILEVEGMRLVIAALTSANASAELVAERQAILDSIEIVP